MTFREFCEPLRSLYGDGEARWIGRVVFEDLFGLSPADILSGDGVGQIDADVLLGLQHRLLDGEPVQYVVGTAPFCGHTFCVEPGVLIPRPETQQLCHDIVGHWNGNQTGTILDIGTGSGCIAVTLALGLPSAEVTAWDISADALRIACHNAERLGARVAFEQRDILAVEPYGDSRRWDVIVSNPPYILQSERAGMERHVTEHEPSLALFVPDADPLCFHRAIAHYALATLKEGGRLLMEINERLGPDTALAVESAGLSDVSLVNDEYGRARFVTAVHRCQPHPAQG